MINVKNFNLNRRIPIYLNRNPIRFFFTKKDIYDTTQDISFNPNPENYANKRSSILQSLDYTFYSFVSSMDLN